MEHDPKYLIYTNTIRNTNNLRNKHESHGSTIDTTNALAIGAQPCPSNHLGATQGLGQQNNKKKIIITYKRSNWAVKHANGVSSHGDPQQKHRANVLGFTMSTSTFNVKLYPWNPGAWDALLLCAPNVVHPSTRNLDHKIYIKGFSRSSYYLSR